MLTDASTANNYATVATGVYKADIEDEQTLFKDCVTVVKTVLEKSTAVFMTAIKACNI